jgi:hypothetical protein
VAEKGLGERLAAVDGLDDVHPLFPQEMAQGAAGFLGRVRYEDLFRSYGSRHVSLG